MGWFNEMQRLSASPENAVQAAARAGADRRPRPAAAGAARRRLIFHSRDDQAVPFAQGEELAAGISRARRSSRSRARTTSCSRREPAWRDVRPTSAASSLRRAMAGARRRSRRRSRRGRDRDELRRRRTARGSPMPTPATGFPLVKAPNWMTHLEHDWTSPVYGHWLARMRARDRLHPLRHARLRHCRNGSRRLRFRAHGRRSRGGDRRRRGRTLRPARHLRTAAPIAIAYAARHPERVRKLVLVNSFAAGWRVRADPEEIALARIAAGDEPPPAELPPQPARRDVHHALFPVGEPGADRLAQRAFQTLGPVKNMEPMIELASRIDVRDELAKIRAPTLVSTADRTATRRWRPGGRSRTASPERASSSSTAPTIRCWRRAGVAGLHREMRAFL